MLYPDRPMRFLWDVLSLIIIGFETFLVPVSLAFADADPPTYYAWFIVAFFTADISSNFFTGFNYRGIVVASMQISAVRYLTSAWLWVDLISLDSSMPCMGLRCSADDAHSVFDLNRMMRVLRLGKLMKLARLRAIVPRIESKLKEFGNHTVLVFFKMGKFLIALLVFAHMIACCWAAIGDLDWDAESELYRP